MRSILAIGLIVALQLTGTAGALPSDVTRTSQIVSTCMPGVSLEVYVEQSVVKTVVEVRARNNSGADIVVGIEPSFQVTNGTIQGGENFVHMWGHPGNAWLRPGIIGNPRRYEISSPVALANSPNHVASVMNLKRIWILSPEDWNRATAGGAYASPRMAAGTQCSEVSVRLMSREAERQWVAAISDANSSSPSGTRSASQTTTAQQDPFFKEMGNPDYRYEGNNSNGKPNGLWRMYRKEFEPSGPRWRIVYEIEFRDGIRHGRYTQFYWTDTLVSTFGQPRRVGNYVNGKEDGVFLEYHSDGSLAQRVYYSNGAETSRQQISDNSALYEEAPRRQVVATPSTPVYPRRRGGAMPAR